MNLFHGHQTEELEGDWNSFDRLPEFKSGKVKAKLSDDSEVFAYFYQDQCQFAKSMYKELSHFWDCVNHDPIHNVKAWKYLKNNKKEDDAN
jgi:hypothetical protein